MKRRETDILKQEETFCEMCKEKATCCIIWDDPLRPIRKLFLCVGCMDIIRNVVCKIVRTEAEKKLSIRQKPRTKEEKMAEVNAILKMTAERKGCKVSDLEWKRDRFGHIFIKKKNGQKETNNQKG